MAVPASGRRAVAPCDGERREFTAVRLSLRSMSAFTILAYPQMISSGLSTPVKEI